MDYITSRPYELPASAAGLQAELFFNLWGRKYWPYDVVEVGDILYWYYSPSKTIVWKSRIIDMDRFPYPDKDALRLQLQERFGPFDSEQPYFVSGTNSGYCLAYKVEPLAMMEAPKPEALRFPQVGWLRVEGASAAQWVSPE